MRLAHRFAMENDLITADCIESTEFPDLAGQYRVYAVPKTVINEQASIEGDKDTIVFLADLLLAQVLDCDCGTGISPAGPGSVYFNPKSQYGIYIHTLPCKNEEVGGRPAH